MYAVIRTGGKQYRVAPNDVIQVERLSTGPGESVDFEEVLLVGEGAATTAGTPHVKGAKVRAEVLEEIRGEKIIVFKKKRRQGYRRKQGHRQNLTVLRITDITDADGKTVSAPKAKAKPAVKAKAPDKKAPDKKAGAKPKTEAKAAETKAKAKPKAATSKAAAPKTKAAPKKKAAGATAKASTAKAKASPKAKSAPKKGSAKEKK